GPRCDQVGHQRVDVARPQLLGIQDVVGGRHALTPTLGRTMPNSGCAHHMLVRVSLCSSVASFLLCACAARSSDAPAGSQGAPPVEASVEAESAVSPAEAPIPAPAQDELVAHEDVAEAPAPAPVRPLPEDYLHFGGACDPGRIVTVAAIGDLMFHHELQQQAYRAPDRFLDLWSSVIDLLGAADITYGNLESPAAWGIDRKVAEAPDPGLRIANKVYSGYATFNVHPSMADDLVRTGFDVVSTANNHALDRGSRGVDRTLDALDQAGLRHTGTRRRGTAEPWHT